MSLCRLQYFLYGGAARIPFGKGCREGAVKTSILLLLITMAVVIVDCRMLSAALKRPGPASTVCIVPCILALFVAGTGAAPPETFKLSGRVLGSSGKNVVYVALWQADGFLKRPVQQVRTEPGPAPVFQFEVPAGRWAVSAFEDRNGNGTLDMGWFGPKEPSGFWRAFTGWHKPRFDEVASIIERDIPKADITLK
jgi:hypothetical protein